MAKITNGVKNVDDSTCEINDTVIFMTAYKIHGFKRHLVGAWKRKKSKKLLNQCHIAGIAYQNMYVSPKRRCYYTAEYNSLKQITSFDFDEIILEIEKKDPVFVNEMLNTLSLYHSSNALLDTSLVKVNMCFNMESFLVDLNGTIYQVDPVVFFMNDALIVNFELVNFETTIPLSKSDIYGRRNNFNIQHVEKIKYFDEIDFKDESRKISDIIFNNVISFFEQATKNKCSINNFSFVHNILVLSNNINDIQEYFQKVLGAKIQGFQKENISATESFEYYSSESLGIVTSIKNSDIHNILYDCMMLESFKVYLLLKMVIDYEITLNLNKIIDNQIFVEGLFYPLQVPIITLNMIDNLKETASFSRYKQAVDFKINALKIKQERRHTNNGLLLNFLLYVLAMIGSAQTLQVLDDEFGLPFNITFWVVISIFIVFGIICGYQEINNK